MLQYMYWLLPRGAAPEAIFLVRSARRAGRSSGGCHMPDMSELEAAAMVEAMSYPLTRVLRPDPKTQDSPCSRAPRLKTHLLLHGSSKTQDSPFPRVTAVPTDVTAKLVICNRKYSYWHRMSGQICRWRTTPRHRVVLRMRRRQLRLRP